MKKLYLFIFILSLFLLNNNTVFSAYYGNHAVWYTLWITNCDDDSDWINDIWNNKVAQSNNSVTLIPEPGGFWALPTWTMRCLYWDGQNPSISATPTPAWRVKDIIITLNASDTWWSWLVGWLAYTKYSTDAIACTSWTSYNNWDIINSAWAPEWIHTLHLCASDVAWNLSTWNWDYKIDRTGPTISASPASSWWVQNISIVLYASDSYSWLVGWSAYTQYKWDSSSWISYSNWQTISTNWLLEWSHTLYLRASDAIWNLSTWTSWTYLIDRTSPAFSNILTSTSIDLLATNSQTFNFFVNESWVAPITTVEWYFEDYSKCFDEFLGKDVSGGSVNKNTSEVKPSCNFTAWIWWRYYTYKVTRVVDAAWNEWNWTKNFDFKVYANSNSIATKEFNISQVNLINSWTLIADWTPQNLTLTLKDTYSNPIIPAPWISRTIDLNFNVANTLYLDQHLRTWSSAVYLTTPNNPSFFDISLFSTNYPAQIPTNLNNWDYNFAFKLYTPTNNSYNKAYWNFTINNVKYKVNWIIWSTSEVLVNNSAIAFKYKPIYVLVINWELKSYWFVEWATQSWTISISKNWTASTTNNKIYIEFWNLNSNTFSAWLKMNSTLDTWSGSVWEWNVAFASNNLFKSAFSTASYILHTLLRLDWWLLGDLHDAYFSTHIWYTIDGMNVVYNWDIIWKSSYWDLISTNGTSLIWLKILWKTHSKNQLDLSANQGQNDIHIIWNIEKSILKANIRKNVYEKIKFVNYVPGSNEEIKNLSNLADSTSNGWKLLADNVIYIWDLDWELTVLDSGTNNVIGKKTIVIYWWDLYIKSNIINDTNSDLLWIIVMKNQNWKWWNIYIDPSVTKIDWIMYADKSLISYDWTKELDWTTTQYVLRNQLYIYGSVFSSNTIWGSRNAIPICPYYVWWTCDLNNAQKYDLNYLRRYFVIWWTPLNWWINYLNVYNSWYKYFEYPIVIKYNSLIQTSPPPLFWN